MKIILGGPPHSGKSCLRYGLKEAIKSIPASCYPYVITACPDGEGCWFQEAYSNDHELAQQLKLPYKSKFSSEKVEMWADWVNQSSEPLIIIDIGGIPESSNEQICKNATHAVLVAGDLEALHPWRAFCAKLNLQIIAEIHSDLHGTTDKPLSISDTDNVYRGSVHHLERGDVTIKTRPTVIELAQLVVQMENHPKYSIMGTYNITVEPDNILRLKFGETSAQNDMLVKEAVQIITTLINDGKVTGGELIKLNGPATIPVAFALAHKLNHLYQAVAVYDPKLSKYVVAVAHGGRYRLGDLID